MSFGSGSGSGHTKTPRPGSSGSTGNNWVGYRGDSGLPAYNPVNADNTVLLAGLMGLRPNKSPALASSFATGSSSGMGRRPSLAKRVTLGGV